MLGRFRFVFLALILFGIAPEVHAVGMTDNGMKLVKNIRAFLDSPQSYAPDHADSVLKDISGEVISQLNGNEPGFPLWDLLVLYSHTIQVKYGSGYGSKYTVAFLLFAMGESTSAGLLSHLETCFGYLSISHPSFQDAEWRRLFKFARTALKQSESFFKNQKEFSAVYRFFFSQYTMMSTEIRKDLYRAFPLLNINQLTVSQRNVLGGILRVKSIPYLASSLMLGQIDTETSYYVASVFREQKIPDPRFTSLDLKKFSQPLLSFWEIALNEAQKLEIGLVVIRELSMLDRDSVRRAQDLDVIYVHAVKNFSRFLLKQQGDASILAFQIMLAYTGLSPRPDFKSLLIEMFKLADEVPDFSMKAFEFLMSLHASEGASKWFIRWQYPSDKIPAYYLHVRLTRAAAVTHQLDDPNAVKAFICLLPVQNATQFMDQYFYRLFLVSQVLYLDHIRPAKSDHEHELARYMQSVRHKFVDEILSYGSLRTDIDQSMIDRLILKNAILFPSHGLYLRDVIDRLKRSNSVDFKLLNSMEDYIKIQSKSTSNERLREVTLCTEMLKVQRNKFDAN